MVKLRRTWHAIISFGQHTQSNDVGCGLTSPHLESIHGRMTVVVKCHHRLSTTHTVERRRACHAIIAFGQHKQSNEVGRVMPSSPLGSTNGRMTLRLACHHRLEAAQTVEQRRAWHDITALGLHVQSDDVGRGMTSVPLDNTHGQQRRELHDITAIG